jgi:hypothetical protein
MGLCLAFYQWCWPLLLAWVFSFLQQWCCLKSLIPTDLFVYCLTIYHSESLAPLLVLKRGNLDKTVAITLFRTFDQATAPVSENSCV